MAINSKYLFVVSMDVDSNKEALFNEIYDTEHIPNLLKTRCARSDANGRRALYHEHRRHREEGSA